jgi:hypothetical protein
MAGKLGPANEFQDIMVKTFQSCIDALTDTEAWNDSMGFRQLAKVLVVVPWLQRDAQIAYSLQFSTVDQCLADPPEESVLSESAEAEDSEDVVTNGETAISERNSDSEDEDLSTDSAINYSGCLECFSNWNDGSVYFCIICTSYDLCEECWKKRDMCNKGKERTDWKKFCGEEHKYIKGPVSERRGVKGSAMRFL